MLSMKDEQSIHSFTKSSPLLQNMTSHLHKNFTNRRFGFFSLDFGLIKNETVYFLRKKRMGDYGDKKQGGEETGGGWGCPRKMSAVIGWRFCFPSGGYPRYNKQWNPLTLGSFGWCEGNGLRKIRLREAK